MRWTEWCLWPSCRDPSGGCSSPCGSSRRPGSRPPAAPLSPSSSGAAARNRGQEDETKEEEEEEGGGEAKVEFFVTLSSLTEVCLDGSIFTNSFFLTCSLFELRQRWFVDIIVDSGRVAVVTDEEQIADSGVSWTLPQCQTEPGNHIKTPEQSQWHNVQHYMQNAFSEWLLVWGQTEGRALLINKWFNERHSHGRRGSWLFYRDDWLRSQLMCCQPLRANRAWSGSVTYRNRLFFMFYHRLWNYHFSLLSHQNITKIETEKKKNVTYKSLPERIKKIIIKKKL